MLNEQRKNPKKEWSLAELEAIESLAAHLGAFLVVAGFFYMLVSIHHYTGDL
jgi:hypothetical protein